MPAPWIIALLLVMGLIFLGLVGYLFFQVGRVLWRLPGEIRGARMRKAEELRRRAAINILPPSEAERMARDLLDKVARTTPWESQPSDDLTAQFDRLNPGLAALLRQYRHLCFENSGTEISAELMREDVAPEGMWVIGRTGDQGGEFGRCLLCVEPTLPVVHEVLTEDIYGNGQRVTETYPSLFHYLLLMEAPDHKALRARVHVRCWPIQLPSGDGRVEGGHFITYPDGFGGHELLTCTKCGHLYAVDAKGMSDTNRTLGEAIRGLRCIGCSCELAGSLQPYPETYLDRGGKLLRHERTALMPDDAASVVHEFDQLG